MFLANMVLVLTERGRLKYGPVTEKSQVKTGSVNSRVGTLNKVPRRLWTSRGQNSSAVAGPGSSRGTWPAHLAAPDRGLRREVCGFVRRQRGLVHLLEQGREMRVSDEVLNASATPSGSRKTSAPTSFRWCSAGRPILHHDRHLDVAPEISRLVAGVPLPSIAMNLRWDVLAWNRLNAVIFRDYALLPVEERNLVEQLFTRPLLYGTPQDTENMARRILAKLRVDYSRIGDDPKFEAMIRRLESTSALFRTLWRGPDINVGSYGINRISHPKYGDLAFENVSSVPDGHPSLRLVICLPADDRTRAIVAQLSAGQAADDPSVQ